MKQKFSTVFLSHQMEKLILIFLLLIPKQSLGQSAKVNLVSLAIKEIVDSHYVKNSIGFDLIIYGRETRKLTEIASQLLLLSKESFAVKVITFDEKVKKEQFQLTQPAILLFDTSSSFLDFNRNLQLVNKLPKRFSFLVYYSTSDGVKQGFDKLFYKVFLTHDNDSSIRMRQFNFFSADACRKWSSKEINRFSPKLLKWEKSIKINHEFENFHGCGFVFLILNLCKPVTHFEVHSNGTFTPSGYAVDFFEALAKVYNFKIIYSPFDTNEARFLNPNLKMEFSTQVGSLSNYKLIDHPNRTSVLSKTFGNNLFGFVIPKGELYTPLEKLILPFDIETWFWFAIFIAGGIVAIFIIKIMPKVIQNFVFGRNVQTPILNMTQAFFGVGQLTLPGRNFARYLLMMFILFCLIIRTAYQGKMFEFLQQEMRKPEVKSVEEMIANNFTFLTYDHNVEMFEPMDIFRGFAATFISRVNSYKFYFRAKFTTMNYSTLLSKKLLEKLSHPNSKQALILMIENLPFVVAHANISTALTVLKQTFLTAHIGFTMQKDNFLNHQINRKITQAVESGLMDYWRMNYDPKPISEQPAEPQVLTMEHLALGFNIFLLCLAISFIAFIAENIKQKIVDGLF